MIREAYRRLSSEHHPDKNNGNGDFMSEINVAYETLIDPERRKRYDETGESGSHSRLESEAEELVMQIVSQLMDQVDLDNPFTSDLFNQVYRQIEAQEQEVLRAKEQARRTRLKFEKLQKRLKFNKQKKARRDFLKMVFQDRIDRILEGDKKAARHLEMLSLAKAYSQAYELEPHSSPSGIWIRV